MLHQALEAIGTYRELRYRIIDVVNNGAALAVLALESDINQVYGFAEGAGYVVSHFPFTRPRSSSLSLMAFSVFFTSSA